MNNIHQLHHVLILSQDFEVYRHLIEYANLPGLSITATDNVDEALLTGHVCDLMLGEPFRVSKVVNQLPGVIWVQTTWAGVEPLMGDGIRQDYLLTNARDVYGSMMSEYVFGYLLAIARRILPRWESQRRGKWDEQPYDSLKGKLLGLLGVGTIGAHLAKTGKHFDMRVYGYTRKSEACQYVDRYFHGQEWADFASDLDYLVCSLPGTPGTKTMLDTARIAAIPRKAWLVNIGRGSTLDEVALVEALKLGAIGGAVLDVFQEEPLPTKHALWSTPNTFITSHTAARNYLPDIAAIFIENYKLLIHGKPLLHQVDFNQGY